MGPKSQGPKRPAPFEPQLFQCLCSAFHGAISAVRVEISTVNGRSYLSLRVGPSDIHGGTSNDHIVVLNYPCGSTAS